MENVTFEEFIIGTLLGDGCIAKLSKGGKNYRWSCGHSEKQLEYCKKILNASAEQHTENYYTNFLLIIKKLK